jgi:hypothetical protein
MMKRHSLLFPSLVLLALATSPYPASASQVGARNICTVDAYKIASLARGTSASARVLAVVASHFPRFNVEINFEGPLDGGPEARQIEIMRSVASELALPGAPTE